MKFLSIFFLATLVAACTVDDRRSGRTGFDSGARGFDSGPGYDSGPGFDASPGFDSGPGFDASPGFDSGPGFDAGPAIDAGGGPSTCGDTRVTGEEVCDGTPGCATDCLSATYSGDIASTDPTWSRNTSTCSAGTATGYYYDTQDFVWLGDGSTSLTFRAAWSGFDGYLHAFDGTFSSSSPTTGCLAGDDDDGGTSGSAVTVEAMSGEAFDIVLSTFSAGSTGSWTLTITR